MGSWRDKPAPSNANKHLARGIMASTSIALNQIQEASEPDNYRQTSYTQPFQN
jgi:hypothetical protein